MEIGSAYALQVCLLQIPAMVAFSAIYDPRKLGEFVDTFTSAYSRLLALCSRLTLARSYSRLIFPQYDTIAIIFSIFLLTYTYIEARSNYHRGSILILACVAHPASPVVLLRRLTPASSLPIPGTSPFSSASTTPRAKPPRRPRGHSSAPALATTRSSPRLRWIRSLGSSTYEHSREVSTPELFELRGEGENERALFFPLTFFFPSLLLSKSLTSPSSLLFLLRHDSRLISPLLFTLCLPHESPLYPSCTVPPVLSSKSSCVRSFGYKRLLPLIVIEKP